MSKTARWVIGILITVTLSQTGFIVKLWVNDLAHIEQNLERMCETTEGQLSQIAEQLADMRQEIRDGQWEAYSAWGYQLNVNNTVMLKLNIPKTDQPVPPVHLRNRP